MHTFLSKKTLKAGFTLIELLVVIAIIGILASVVLASLNTGRQKARDAKRAADLRQIQTSMILYADSSATGGANYPTPDTGANCTTVGSCLPDRTGVGDGDKVLKFFPSGAPKDPNGADYLYYGDSDTFCTSVDYEADVTKGFACDQEQCRQKTAAAAGTPPTALDCANADTKVKDL